jgi:hypothetical protein
VTQGEYVALAYGAVFVFVLVYVAIIAAKLARLQRDTTELLERIGAREELDRAPVYAAPVHGSGEGQVGPQ